MLQNASVTASTFCELLRENQQRRGEIKLHPPTQITVKIFGKKDFLVYPLNHYLVQI